VRWKEENKRRGLGTVVPVSNLSTREAVKFKANLGYIARPSMI
jgi:hypothetical protein